MEVGISREQGISRREEIGAPRNFCWFGNIELIASFVFLCMSGVSDEYDWSLKGSVFGRCRPGFAYVLVFDLWGRID